MRRAPGLVFALDPRTGPGLLAACLGADDACLPASGRCGLELVADDPARPRELHAVVFWTHAVPLRVERLVRAVLAAGGTLRRDLDAEGLRAGDAGLHVLRVRRADDLDGLLTPPPEPAPPPRLISAA